MAERRKTWNDLEVRCTQGSLSLLRKSQEERRKSRRRNGLGMAMVVLALLTFVTTSFAAPLISDRAPDETLQALLEGNQGFAQAYQSGSRFVTGDKNSVELCNFAQKAVDEGWKYVYGSKGQTMNPSLINAIIYSNLNDERSPYLREGYIGETREKTPTGMRATDCSGLIMSFMWWAGDQSEPIRSLCTSIGMYNANNMLEAAVEKGPVAAIPEIPGLLVHSNGHVGIYIGGGEVIEARGVQFGVVKTELSDRSFKYWSKSPWVDYEVSGIYKVGDRTVFLDNGEDIGQERWVAKYVYGDAAQGSTYVPTTDAGASFRSEAPTSYDLEEAPATGAVPTASAAASVQPAIPEMPQQSPSVLEEVTAPPPAEVTQPIVPDVVTPGPTPVPSAQPSEAPLVDRILEVIDTLPYDALQGYLFEGHWYLILMDETGIHTVLNDPPNSEGTGAADTDKARRLQEAIARLRP